MKRYLLGILAFVLAIGLSSYTASRAFMQVYYIVGENTDYYILSDYDPLDCNSGFDQPCMIYIEPNRVNPNHTILKTDLADVDIFARREGRVFH